MSYKSMGNVGLFKNTNLEKLLRNSNLLLENIFSANFKEFERFWYPLKFHLTAPLSTSSITKLIDQQIDFSFSYYITSLSFYSQTNGLAGFGLEINGQFFPAQSYTITTSALNETKLYYSSMTTLQDIPFKLYVDKPFNLVCYAMNTHTSDQIIYLTINGYRVNLDQILKLIRKGRVKYQ